MSDEGIQSGSNEQDPNPPRRPRIRRFEEDDDNLRRIRRDDDDDNDDQPGAVETLIPYRNPLALTGYYLGVFSLIPCLGLALGPAALTLGILGLRARKKNPRAGGLGHAITALVLGLLTTLGNWGIVLFFIGMAATR